MKNIKYKEIITLNFPQKIQRKMRKEINLHYVGVENCNKYDEEKRCYVSAFPEKETQEMTDAHWGVSAGFSLALEIEVNPINAEIINVKWLNKVKSNHL